MMVATWRESLQPVPSPGHSLAHCVPQARARGPQGKAFPAWGSFPSLFLYSQRDLESPPIGLRAGPVSWRCAWCRTLTLAPCVSGRLQCVRMRAQRENKRPRCSECPRPEKGLSAHESPLASCNHLPLSPGTCADPFPAGCG